MTKLNARHQGNWQGMNWITQQKRLAIYLRDGLTCTWCGATAQDGTKLSLDHLKAHVKGGSNDETNLVACCSFCNTSRGARSMSKFAAAVAGYINHGVLPEHIVARVRAAAKRKLTPYKPSAKALIEKHGSVANFLSSLKS